MDTHHYTTTANGDYQVQISEIRDLESHSTLTGCASKKNLTGNVFSFICLFLPNSLYSPQRLNFSVHKQFYLFQTLTFKIR